jgi:putative ABC transport system substrate-binding protein
MPSDKFFAKRLQAALELRERLGMRSGLAVFLVALLSLSDGAGAQQVKTFRIGFLSPASPAPMAARIDSFKQGLQDLGYFEGRNIILEYRWAEGKEDRLQGLASELVPRVDIVVAHGALAARIAKQASATVPIVCFGCGDAVAAGLVASLARPGGNITGQTTLAPEATGKRIELLKEAVPGIARLAVLWNSGNPVSGPELKETEEAARAGGLRLQSVSVANSDEFPRAFSSMRAENAEAVLVLSDAMFFGNRKQIAELAIAERLPAVSWTDEYAKSGFMLTYGPDVYVLSRRAAIYVDKILKGVKPADLPLEQPTKFDFVVNLRTAKAIGLTLPPALLARADEVIE